MEGPQVTVERKKYIYIHVYMCICVCLFVSIYIICMSIMHVCSILLQFLSIQMYIYIDANHVLKK